MSSTSSFFVLPGELRNIIYEYYFDIEYLPRLNRNEPLRWSRKPAGLSSLLRVNRQIHEEASSLFYNDFFPMFELSPVSFMDLNRFTCQVPEQHRGVFRARLSVLALNGQEILNRVGLHSQLPWTCLKEVKSGAPGRQVEKKLRGDCFLCTHFSSFGGAGGMRHDYDRITIVGHLGRLQWTTRNTPRIQFYPPLRRENSEPLAEASGLNLSERKLHLRGRMAEPVPDKQIERPEHTLGPGWPF